MLTLLLLRHAKSSWDDPAMSDHDRPLADRGERAAPLMGSYLAHHQLFPDRILCSTSQRTRSTLDRVLPLLQRQPRVDYEEGLYLAEADALLARLRKVPSGSHKVMMIGHNPGFEDLARMLTGAGDAASRAALAEKFPTAGLAVITFPSTSWSSITAGSGTLERFVTPRVLEKTGV